MYHNKYNNGFTLVEVLVIIPVILLTISGFVAVMVTMVGDVLKTREQNNLVYQTQDAIDRIEQDIRLSVKFLDTTGAVTYPQGIDDNTGAFTSTNAFVLKTVATDENPQSNSRWILYYANQPNPCWSNHDINTIFTYTTVYFVKNNTLWKRTLVPPYNANTGNPDENTLCTSPYFLPWQLNTCTEGISSSQCQTTDIKILDYVDNFTIEYYSSPDSTTTLPATSAPNALTVKATLKGQKKVAGKYIDATATIRATRISSLNAE